MSTRSIWFIYLCTGIAVMGLLAVVAGCSATESGEAEACAGSASVPLDAGSCLIFEDGGQVSDRRDVIVRVIRDAYAAINARMPVEEVQIRITVQQSGVIPELGIGGFSPNEEEVLIYVDPNAAVLAQSLENDLPQLLAHELHHTKRRRTAGYGSTLFQAMISEGLADHFGIEVFGAPPPIWSQAVTGPELERVIEQASGIWDEPSYDHSGWFFGTNPEIPRWAGYSAGFDIVGAFLAEHSDRRASMLFDEPAASFYP